MEKLSERRGAKVRRRREDHSGMADQHHGRGNAAADFDAVQSRRTFVSLLIRSGLERIRRGGLKGGQGAQIVMDRTLIELP